MKVKLLKHIKTGKFVAYDRNIGLYYLCTLPEDAMLFESERLDLYDALDEFYISELYEIWCSKIHEVKGLGDFEVITLTDSVEALDNIESILKYASCSRLEEFMHSIQHELDDRVVHG